MLHGPFFTYERANLFGLCYLVHLLLIIFLDYVTCSGVTLHVGAPPLPQRPVFGAPPTLKVER